ncbi:MAG: hypothetical protein HEP71_32515 [Roseivirga sp.]|nr:hypothetical protein [Roseivirga sp.]
MKVVFKLVGVLAVVIIGYLAFFIDGYGKKIEFNGTDVYYTELVSEAEAQKLGTYLVSSEFADGNEKSVQLSKRDSVYLFRMVVMDGVTKDSTNDITFMAMAWTLSANVFDNAPVELEACDNTFETLRVYK